MEVDYIWTDPISETQTRRLTMQVYEKQGHKRYEDGLCVIWKTYMHSHMTYTQLNEFIDKLKALAETMKR